MLKRLYGISLEDWENMFDAQGRMCAICGGSDPGKGIKRWHTDHDHITNSVRGILCRACNIGVGLFHDNPAFLSRASEYLVEQARK